MSSLKSESTEDLVRKKKGLEDFAAAAMAEGIEPSDDIKNEITTLREELELRGAANAQVEFSGHWLGAQIDDFTPEAVLGESNFAYVFSVRTAIGQPKVLRLAKAEIATLARKEKRARTAAFAVSADGAEPVKLRASVVVKEQIEILQKMKTVMPAAIEERGFQGDQPYYTMPQFEGQTLRELIDLGSIPLDIYLVEIFVNLIGLLEKLEQAGAPAHFNLKPEHVILTRTAVHLLSPGVTLAGQTAGGHPVSHVVTTPDYYPWLQPDDKLAVGIMLWEAVCKVHPFASGGEKHLEKRLAEPFRHQIQSDVSKGYSTLAALLQLKMPSEIKHNLPTQAEKVLLKAVRLGFLANGQLSSDSGYRSWTEFADAVRTLS